MFKVGDKVRVVSIKGGPYYEGEYDHYIGHEAFITKFEYGECYSLNFQNYKNELLTWYNSELELVREAIDTSKLIIQEVT